MEGIGRPEVSSAIPVDYTQELSPLDDHAAPALPDRPGGRHLSPFQGGHGIDQVGRECQAALQRKDMYHQPPLLVINANITG